MERGKRRDKILKYHKPNTSYNKKTKSKAGNTGWWEPQRGGIKNEMRIMPPWDSQGICIVRRVLHYGYEVDERNRAFPCLEDNDTWLKKAPCPTCHLVKKLLVGDSDERDIAKELDAGSPPSFSSYLHYKVISPLRVGNIF